MGLSDLLGVEVVAVSQQESRAPPERRLQDSSHQGRDETGR